MRNFHRIASFHIPSLPPFCAFDRQLARVVVFLLWALAPYIIHKLGRFNERANKQARHTKKLNEERKERIEKGILHRQAGKWQRTLVDVLFNGGIHIFHSFALLLLPLAFKLHRNFLLNAFSELCLFSPPLRNRFSTTKTLFSVAKEQFWKFIN